MSKHYHFEANLSLTGANADERYMVKPSEFGKVIAALYNEVASATGNAKVSDGKIGNANASKAIVKAVTHYKDPAVLLECSRGLKEAMPGIDINTIPEAEKLQSRGW